MQTGRRIFFRESLRLWKSWMVAGVWTVLCTIDVFVGKYATSAGQTTWAANWKHPILGWKVWIIGMLLIGICAVLEGSYRQYHTLENKYNELEATINGIGPRKVACRQLLMFSVNAYKKAAGSTDVYFEENDLREFVGEYADVLHAVLDSLVTEGRATQNPPGVWQIT